jgi:hypothetical protein
MPETHIPKLDRPVSNAARPVRETRTKSLLHIALEVILISVGVFLGLAGEQWREHRHHQQLAESSLRDFRSEIMTNRKAIEDVKEYHATLLKSLKEYLAKDHKSRNTAEVRINGLRFVSFDQTAWDLALTTEALTYIDRDLAFELSRVYNEQKYFSELTRGMTQAMYLIPLQENFDGFAQAAEVYYGDAVFVEPKLIGEYDALLHHIDRVLGD